ncbi:MAG: glutamate formimidoyltransferase [Bryobacter sp.]|nr:glutamate formimidoyltransferase [Bryobacter sp.]
MAAPLVECVPNFSASRETSTVDAIVSAIRDVPGVAILDREMDDDHNRSVITMAGAPEAVLEAAIRAVGCAAARIDLNRHQGVHPRIGATDVVPFIPIHGVSMADCVRLAERAAAEIWTRYQVPSYFYEAAARRPERVNLENIRKGQFEGLREEVKTNADRRPDVGGPELHPTAGATVVGARQFLIAYNINLATSDVEIAKRIAKAIRHSSGGFRFVKAMGVSLASRNLAQVSMNLTDFEQTPVHRVYEAVRAEAARYGVNVLGSEIIGLIPKRALELTADHFLRVENFSPRMVLENRLAEELQSLSGLPAFLSELAAPTPAPGGGSASAAAAAMAAGLGEMVARLNKVEGFDFATDRAFFTAAVTRDADAFNVVMSAYKRPKDERAPHVESALQGAALVPLEVLERATALDRRLAELEASTPSRFGSDLVSARALAGAARTGARANVEINLASLKDPDFIQSVKLRLAALN